MFLALEQFPDMFHPGNDAPGPFRVRGNPLISQVQCKMPFHRTADDPGHDGCARSEHKVRILHCIPIVVDEIGTRGEVHLILCPGKIHITWHGRGTAQYQGPAGVAFFTQAA